MRDLAIYWWYVYGNFRKGEGNLPHIGDVIRYYRKLKGLPLEQLASHLGCTERYISMLESKANMNMPELLSRRVLLAKTLEIPPILLGLSAITVIDDDTIVAKTIEDADTIIDTRELAFYEGMLGLAWDLYYSSSVQRAAKQVESCFDLLNHDAKDAIGIKLNQYDSMRCRFYQLFSLLHRDQANGEQGIEDTTQALLIAERLQNAGLIASSLLRRARIYISSGKFDLAYADSQKALPYADLSRDPLKGKCYQMAGEAQAYVAGKNKALQEKSLSYFHVAGKLARKGKLTPDGSFVKLDITSVYIEQAKALRLFGRYDEAHNALAVARKNLQPGVLRWEINLFLQEATIYFEQKEYSVCCSLLGEALKIVQAVDSLPTKRNEIIALYQRCRAVAPQLPEVQKLGKMLGPGIKAS
jgi:transcriptional regulator with XRE-family HTH domain